MDLNTDLYYQLVLSHLNPPAIVQELQLPLDCQAQNLRLTIKGSLEDLMRYFPDTDGLELRGKVIDLTMEGTLSYSFYKKKDSQREWDFALAYRTKGGMPLLMFIANGQAIEKAEIVSFSDYLFVFTMNPLDASKDNFGLKNLKPFIQLIEITCASGYQKFFNDKFDLTRESAE